MLASIPPHARLVAGFAAEHAFGEARVLATLIGIDVTHDQNVHVIGRGAGLIPAPRGS